MERLLKLGTGSQLLEQICRETIQKNCGTSESLERKAFLNVREVVQHLVPRKAKSCVETLDVLVGSSCSDDISNQDLK